MNEKTVLPLTNSCFLPGEARKTVERFQDTDTRNIARAELYYFQGNAQACSDITELYLMSPKIGHRLSACILYVYSNLTLGNVSKSQQGLADIKEILRQEWENPGTREREAFCVFVSYLGDVLLHIMPERQLNMKEYMADLPHGLKLFSMYVMAHSVYLKGEYGRAIGICQSAIYFSHRSHPICMIYLYCMIAMCEISQKHMEEAREAFSLAWNMAEEDSFLEPFIEHHGLFQGLLESQVKKENPKIYKLLSERTKAFSSGWMAVHNHATGNQITDSLTTMEFSIAMLACRDWSNQEIADHLGLSINTVKHYLSDIFEKLGINKREELKKFVLT